LTRRTAPTSVYVMSGRLALAVAIGLAATSLSACSGKQESAASGNPSGRLTKAQFIARGDAVCKEIEQVPDTIPAPADTSDIGAVADYIQQGLDKTRPKVEQFKALRPPASDQAVADRLKSTYDQLLAKEVEVIAAARAHNQAAYQTAQDAVGELVAKLRDEASAYGFKVCGA
jgi:hypothetical protein